MALAAILCAADSRTVEEKRQDLKYSRMSSSTTEANEFRLNNKPQTSIFKKKPRGPKNNVVQIIHHPNRAHQRDQLQGGAGKRNFSNNPQQSIGILAKGLKENGTYFLKNRYPFKRSLTGKKSTKDEKHEQQVVKGTPVHVDSHVTTPLSLQDNATSSQNNLPRRFKCSESCDSGNGDDLSSSCESSIVLNNTIETQSPLQPTVQQCVVLEEDLSPEDDVFMDALSNISSDDDYLTPLSSRTPSMECLTITHTTQQHATQTSSPIANNVMTTTNDNCTLLNIESVSSDNVIKEPVVTLPAGQYTNSGNTQPHHHLTTSVVDKLHCSSGEISSDRHCSLTDCSGLDEGDRLLSALSSDIIPTTDSTSVVLSAVYLTTPTMPNPTLSPHTQSPTTPVTMRCTTHPLYYDWVLWYDKMTTGRPQFTDYAAHLKRVSSISSVEEFWSVINNILLPSQLDKNTNYHFFKEGVQPLWEDPVNKHGGKWVITFRNGNTSLDSVWIELLMALIGEHIDKSQLITGMVLSRRKKGDRIAVWTTVKDKTYNLMICQQLLSVMSVACDIGYRQFVLDITERDSGCGLDVVYMLHKDSMRTGTSYQNQPHLILKQHMNFMLQETVR